MRIAIFSDTYAPEINGVALTLKRYTDYLERQGIEYRIFAPTTSERVPEVPQVERLTSLPFLLYKNCRVSLPNPTHINQVLDDFKPTFIHIATPFSIGLAGLQYGKKHNIPMVASYHTHFDDYLEYYHLTFLKNWIWKYMTWFHRSFERVYVPSESTKEKLLEKNMHDDIDIWGRGVDHHFFTPAKKSQTYFKEKYNIDAENILLYVGRVSPEKDIEVALDTFNGLPEHIKTNTHLVIVGDGPLFATLSETHKENITWTGFLEGEELSNVYASSDIFLFPSATETFGNVVLEAMSSGLPVIGADAGGVKNLVAHGENGFLCEPKNVTDFINHTTTLLENKTLLNNFSQAARTYANTKSWDEIFNQLLANFNDVLKQIEKIAA